MNTNLSTRDTFILNTLFDFRVCNNSQLQRFCILHFKKHFSTEAIRVRLNELNKLGFVSLIKFNINYYFISTKGLRAIHSNAFSKQISFSVLLHCSCVVDTALFFFYHYRNSDIVSFHTDRHLSDLKREKGYNTKFKNSVPDLVLFVDNQLIFILEVELTLKNKDYWNKKINSLQDNYILNDNNKKVLFIIPKNQRAMRERIKDTVFFDQFIYFHFLEDIQNDLILIDTLFIH